MCQTDILLTTPQLLGSPINNINTRLESNIHTNKLKQCGPKHCIHKSLNFEETQATDHEIYTASASFITHAMPAANVQIIYYTNSYKCHTTITEIIFIVKQLRCKLCKNLRIVQKKFHTR